MVIRSTVKPHEKSKEESSEDRQQSKDRSTEAPAAPEPVAARTSGAVAAGAPWTPAPRVSRSVSPPAVVYESQEWASGHADEGIL